MRREKCFVIITFILTMILTVQSAGDGKFNKFQTKILNLHNKYREIHRVAPLFLDENMCKDAKNLATAISQRSDVLPTIQYNTNIYNLFNLPNRTPTKVTADTVVTDWYNRVVYYDFSTSASENNPTPKDPDVLIKAQTVEFTQIVWQATQKIGVGKATHEGLTVVVVAYDPPGNTTKLGDYVINVLPPKETQN